LFAVRVIDVDSHLHEPIDWLAEIDAETADAIGPPPRFMDIAGVVFGSSDPTFAHLPETQRPATGYDFVPPGFVEHLELTDLLQPESQAASKGNPYCDPVARLALCDARGIDVQFLNPTFLVGMIVAAAKCRRYDLIRSVQRGWNEWAARQVDGFTDRLVPVTQIDLNDVEWSIGEMTRMRALGSRAFVIPEAPVGGRRGQLGRSITHPDFESVWSAAEDLGMAAVAHVGFSRERVNRGWANNGANDLVTFGVLNMLVASQTAPQLLLAAMALDGVFERHPGLVVLVEEVGIDWLPHLLSTLDVSIGHTPTALRDEHYRPSHLTNGTTYSLPLTPSEYLRGHVRVTPLAASHPLRAVLDQVPPEMLCFSSDYPHVEGSDHAVEIFRRQLDGVDDAVQTTFFGGVADLLSL
jgi:predicted TIM-barrel fold metal-dependent hydrolase